MNLPAASGRGIMTNYLFYLRPKGRGIKPKEIKGQSMVANEGAGEPQVTSGPQERRKDSFTDGVRTQPAACDGLLYEGTPSAAVSMYQPRTGSEGVEGLDSGSIL